VTWCKLQALIDDQSITAMFDSDTACYHVPARLNLKEGDKVEIGGCKEVVVEVYEDARGEQKIFSTDLIEDSENLQENPKEEDDDEQVPE